MVGDTRAAAERHLRGLAARALPTDDIPEVTEPDGAQPLRFASPTEVDARRGLGSILQAGDSLVAVGAVDPHVVDDIADQYVREWERRGDQLIRMTLDVRAKRAEAMSAPVELRPVTVLHGPVEVRLEWGDVTVRHVRFEPAHTVLSITGRLIGAPSAGPAPGDHRFGLPLRDGRPPTAEVADDRGHSSQAHFSGGSRAGGEIDGQLTTAAPLSADTVWLEVDGQRVELSPHKPVAAEVRLEQLERPLTPVTYLWHRVAMLGRPLPHAPPEPPLDVPIAALVAIGALEADDPELDATRRVTAALQDPPGTEPQGPLPQPWDSIVERRAGRRGMRGTIPVEVVTPPVDGISVCVHLLQATAEGFCVEMELAPDGGLAWWAEDDLAGIHLGYVQGIHGGPERALMRAIFLGGLDPGEWRN